MDNVGTDNSEPSGHSGEERKTTNNDNLRRAFAERGNAGIENCRPSDDNSGEDCKTNDNNALVAIQSRQVALEQMVVNSRKELIESNIKNGQRFDSLQAELVKNGQRQDALQTAITQLVAIVTSSLSRSGRRSRSGVYLKDVFNALRSLLKDYSTKGQLTFLCGPVAEAITKYGDRPDSDDKKSPPQFFRLLRQWLRAAVVNDGTNDFVLDGCRLSNRGGVLAIRMAKSNFVVKVKIDGGSYKYGSYDEYAHLVKRFGKTRLAMMKREAATRTSSSSSSSTSTSSSSTSSSSTSSSSSQSTPSGKRTRPSDPRLAPKKNQRFK